MNIRERLENAGLIFDSEEIEKAVTILGFDDAIVGMTEDYRLVYDYDKMVLCLMLHEDMDEDDAIEYIDYNVLRAYQLYGESHPVIIYRI